MVAFLSTTSSARVFNLDIISRVLFVYDEEKRKKKVKTKICLSVIKHGRDSLIVLV